MSEIITGDCLEELEQLDENSVEAIVTDPPYGLAFMGRSWDDFEPKEYQEWCQKWAEKAKTVLKPGGHMLAFSGNRTHHRLFTGVEDAGFEIRDTITWHYGSGFPKALDVSKAIDKAADAEREQVEVDLPDHLDGGAYQGGDGDKSESDATSYYTDTNATKSIPATDAAEKWDGFKTALKPATEYVVVARKPFDGTVAENVQTHGTGALNIEGCRVGTDDNLERKQGGDITGGNYNDATEDSDIVTPDFEGRYPSNVIFDETEAERLDRENGETGDTTANSQLFSTDGSHEGYKSDAHSEYEITERAYEESETGPSRYFYTSKASKAERTLDGKIDNTHPTVKPADLMEWLVTLVTAENQTVLDPFTGSGTTGIACKNKNREFIGIEQNEEYADIARARMGLDVENPDVLRGDDDQQGLESF